MFRNLSPFFLLFSLVLILGLRNYGYAGLALDPANDSQVCITDSNSTNGYEPRAGEILEYDLWVKSVIHGGRQTVKTLSVETLGDREVVKVQCAIKTIGLVRSIAKYSEVEDLTLDRNGLYPLTIRREVHSGKSITIDMVDFDYNKGIATRSYSVDGGDKTVTEIKLPGIVQDAVSLQFFLRKGAFQKGLNKLYYYENGAVEETTYNVSEVKEELRLNCGTYPAYYRIDHSGGKITVLVGQDTYHAPLVIRVLASFGKAEGKLTRIQ